MLRRDSNLQPVLPKIGHRGSAQIIIILVKVVGLKLFKERYIICSFNGGVLSLSRRVPSELVVFNA